MMEKEREEDHFYIKYQNRLFLTLKLLKNHKIKIKIIYHQFVSIVTIIRKAHAVIL